MGEITHASDCDNWTGCGDGCHVRCKEELTQCQKELASTIEKFTGIIREKDKTIERQDVETFKFKEKLKGAEEELSEVKKKSADDEWRWKTYWEDLAKGLKEEKSFCDRLAQALEDAHDDLTMRNEDVAWSDLASERMEKALAEYRAKRNADSR